MRTVHVSLHCSPQIPLGGKADKFLNVCCFDHVDEYAEDA